MIEISHVNRRRYFIWMIVIIISLPCLILCGALLAASISIELSIEDTLMTLFPLIIEGIFIYLILRINSNTVYRIETQGAEYRLTTLNDKTVMIRPQEVKRILHSGERYVLVLDSGRRISQDKTSKYDFSAHIDRKDPWHTFLTKERFPDAEFGSLPLS
jgi:hypothetical protein